MNNKMKTALLALLAATTLLAGCSSDDTSAETTTDNTTTTATYPTDTIQMLVPYAAGGDTDLNARILAMYAQEELGEAIVVVNMEGGGGSTAAYEMMGKDPDGYNCLFWHSSILLNDLMGISDFTYEDMEIACITTVSDVGVWVVNADSPYYTVQDIVDQLKAEPRSLSYATAIGNYSHLQALIFEESAGVELKKVDNGGTSDNIASLLGGLLDIVPIEYGLCADYIESGDFRVIGAVTEERSELIPEVPTFLEQGYDMTNGFEKFYFIAFPEGTPDDVIDTFNDAALTVMQNEDALAGFGDLMFTEKFMTGDEATAFIAEKDAIYKEYQELMLNDEF